MSDKRFKWLLIAGCITVIVVAAIWKYPDAVKANEGRQMKLGEYVYLGPRKIIHVSRKCPKLNYKGFKSERIKVDALGRNVFDETTFCPYCVNDKDYERLLSNGMNTTESGKEFIENDF